MAGPAIKIESPDGHATKTESHEGPVAKTERSPDGDRAWSDIPPARQQDNRSSHHDRSMVKHERWEPREEPRGYRGSSVHPPRYGRHQSFEASGHRYQGDDSERRGHRYRGDDYEHLGHHYRGDDSERRGHHYQGDDYDNRGHRYQGDEYEHRGHRYQGDDYEHGGYRYREDDYERRSRRYEDDRDQHVVEIRASPLHGRGSSRRPSPPRYWDPYEDDYARRERSPPRRRSPSRYRGRPDDDHARSHDHRRGPAHYEGGGYGRRCPIPPRTPSRARPRALPPVLPRAPSLARPRVPPRAPPPAPAPPRAPQPRVPGNGVWLTPRPKPTNVPPLPLDRNLIHCENCNRQHDPRLCRGPVNSGRVNVCARCGSKRHLFEECWFGDPAVDDLDYFLWHPRQGLAPISTRIDLSDRQAIPGRHVRPVYSRKFAQEQYTKEKTEKMRLGLPYLEKTIDYGSLQAPEFECMNTPLDPSLVGYARGPPASRNPKQGHAQAKVETDVDKGMPLAVYGR
ncbi:hypothetical protein DL768_004425 [Monosporascus sp. mg162]|nr:hypothetical protein DL768_004425 [Monosporascus sp. mg162]